VTCHAYPRVMVSPCRTHERRSQNKTHKMRCVTHIFESCHTYECVLSHMDTFCHTYACVVCAHINPSCYKYGFVTVSLRVGHIDGGLMKRHIECILSHMSLSHVTRVNASCHAYGYGVATISRLLKIIRLFGEYRSLL